MPKVWFLHPGREGQGFEITVDVGVGSVKVDELLVYGQLSALGQFRGLEVGKAELQGHGGGSVSYLDVRQM